MPLSDSRSLRRRRVRYDLRASIWIRKLRETHSSRGFRRGAANGYLWRTQGSREMAYPLRSTPHQRFLKPHSASEDHPWLGITEAWNTCSTVEFMSTESLLVGTRELPAGVREAFSNPPPPIPQCNICRRRRCAAPFVLRRPCYRGRIRLDTKASCVILLRRVTHFLDPLSGRSFHCRGRRTGRTPSSPPRPR
jgi:hypothetical protein